MSKDKREVELFLDYSNDSKAIITYEGDDIIKITYEISKIEDYNSLKNNVDKYISYFTYTDEGLEDSNNKRI